MDDLLSDNLLLPQFFLASLIYLSLLFALFLGYAVEELITVVALISLRCGLRLLLLLMMVGWLYSSHRRGQREREEEKAAKKRIKQLERELRRKDAALAETAALLVLRKKAEALWGKDEAE